jgi:hypothetical protein
MKDIRDINNENEIIFDVAMAPAHIISKDIYFIFRSNGEEVEINVKERTSTYQLTFKEMTFIEKHYPHIDIFKYKVIQKRYI